LTFIVIQTLSYIVIQTLSYIVIQTLSYIAPAGQPGLGGGTDPGALARMALTPPHREHDAGDISQF
jgi:hypothetical protein